MLLRALHHCLKDAMRALCITAFKCLQQSSWTLSLYPAVQYHHSRLSDVHLCSREYLGSKHFNGQLLVDIRVCMHMDHTKPGS